jgi:hypothetical protein
MRNESSPPAQLKEWVDRLAPVAEAARETLAGAGEAALAERSGCRRDADGDLHLDLFGQELTVSSGDFVVRHAGSGEPTSSFTASLILTYLSWADGSPPSGRWIGFRELPDGMFYTSAFQSYSGDRLVRELPAGVAAFRSACEALGGQGIGIGDAGYCFAALPRLDLALAYWQGDKEFGPQARVLFDDTAGHYMPTYGLAILGSQLVGRVVKTAGG